MVHKNFFSHVFIGFSFLLAGSNLWALPATHAYLNVPELDKLVKASWSFELKKYSDIVDEALEKEQMYETTHEVFYHAQSSKLRIIQDFLKELYQFLYPATPLTDFYFLRPWYQFPQTINANEFIDNYEDGVPKDWNDNKKSLKKRMLSVNFSLFGSTKNYGNFGECTFKYFFKNKSVKLPIIQDLLTEIFDHFNFDKKHIASLLMLDLYTQTEEGSLYQIFVPSTLVDTIGFAAQRLGTPFRNPIIPAYFDELKQRHMTLMPLLDAYKNNPTLIGYETMDRLQGRLIFSQDILLNPVSSVKIFRYTTIGEKRLKKYQKKLKKITKKIFHKWLDAAVDHTIAPVAPITPEMLADLAIYYSV